MTESKITRDRLAVDGVTEVDQSEYQSFLARVGVTGITIPIQVYRALNLDRDTILEVAVRVADEETQELYGEYREGRKSKSEKVVCPMCGLKGSLWVGGDIKRYIRSDGSKHEYTQYRAIVGHGGSKCYVPIKKARELGWVPELGYKRIKYDGVESVCPICGDEGILVVVPRTREYTTKSGEVHIYNVFGVYVRHKGKGHCNVPISLARERGWVPPRE